MSLALSNRTTGDLMTATIWNTDLIASLNALDPAESEVTTTGTIAALPIPTSHNDLVVRMNNATAATIQGIVAGYAGQKLKLISIGAGSVTVLHQNGTATAANRIICFTAVDRLLAAGTSVTELVYDATTARWRVTEEYAEGNWTPVLGGSGGTSGQVYVVQYGRYVKVGRLVTAYFFVQMSTLGTLTTAAQIQGLPFVTENVTFQHPSVTIGYWTNFTNGFGHVSGYVVPNDTAISLTGSPVGTPTGMANIVQADLANTTILKGSISYVASS